MASLPAGLEALASTSPATITAGADASVLGVNTTRSGLRIQLDPASANPVYLLCRSGAASATNFDVCLDTAKSPVWDGKISDVVWRGTVRSFSVGGKIGVLEV